MRAKQGSQPPGHATQSGGARARFRKWPASFSSLASLPLPVEGRARVPARCRSARRSRSRRSWRRPVSPRPRSRSARAGRRPTSCARSRAPARPRTRRTRQRRPSDHPAGAIRAPAAAGSISSASARARAATPSRTPSTTARPRLGSVEQPVGGQHRERGEHAVGRLGHHRAVGSDEDRVERGHPRRPAARPRAPASRRPSRPSAAIVPPPVSRPTSRPSPPLSPSL